jgi:hypothetical protein
VAVEALLSFSPTPLVKRDRSFPFSVAALAKLGVSSKYQPYPWPSSGGRCEGSVQHAKPTYIMFGTLSGLGSRSAFDFLLKSVHPLLIKKWGKENFAELIAGMRQMPEWAR